MANTFTQIFLQFVFAVSRRQCLIPREHKEQIHAYIGGLIKRRGSKPLAIHCMPDHAHIFIGYKPLISIPDLVKEIKVESNQFIKQHRLARAPFSWQTGYGAFSYSLSHIDRVIKYINNQEQHHSSVVFKTEYNQMLREAGIEYDEKYVFEFFE
jgi:REP element-mobilizing transposase RayT